MKKTLIALLLCPVIAHAGGIVATMPNQNGGRIDLYEVNAPEEIPGCRGALIAKSWANGQSDVFGCWKVVEDTVVINWGPEMSRTYAASDFTLRPQYVKQAEQAKRAKKNNKEIL